MDVQGHRSGSGAGAPPPPSTAELAAKRPGPKKRAFTDRKIKRSIPVKRRQRSYSTQFKIQVVAYLIQTRVPLDDVPLDEQRRGVRRRRGAIDRDEDDGCRDVVYREASDFYAVPTRTIGDWWTKRENILLSPAREGKAMWPEMEIQLYEAFWTTRQVNNLVTMAWFRRHSRDLFATIYPEIRRVFKFSRGWFSNFLSRYCISHRRITHQAQRLPAELHAKVSSFLRFIKRNSQPIEPGTRTRFPPHCIVNFDEIPIPFEFLDGYTYEFKGAKTVSGKTSRSGWGKRQCTLVLYVFADGGWRLKPTIIFHGEGKVQEAEQPLYAQDVSVKFNKAAYQNENLLCEWFDEEFAPVVKELGQEVLLVMDVCPSHSSQLVRDKINNNMPHKVVTAMIPGGLTSLLQPLDTSINSSFKQMLREEVDEAALEWDAQHPDKKWSVSDKRVLITHAVSRVCQRLQTDKKDIVIKSFKDNGISILPDGSENHLINIKDINRDTLIWDGWERAGDIPDVGELDDIPEDEDDDGLVYEVDDEERQRARERAFEKALEVGKAVYGHKTVPVLKEMIKERGLSLRGMKVKKDYLVCLILHDKRQQRAQQAQRAQQLAQQPAQQPAV